MIHNLPKSLIDTATQHITEALESPTHKAMVRKASKSSIDHTGLTAAQRISQHVFPAGQDRIVIPLEKEPVEAHPQVAEHLSKSGYDVHDYEKGLAVKKGETKNPVSIGKVLERTNAPEQIKKIYQKDPSRQGLKSSASIVISRKPEDVAAMSTHQKWQSCQTLGGSAKDADGVVNKQEKGGEADHIPEDVKAGTHVAYLVNHPEDIDKHYTPIARIALKPYSTDDGANTILHPMGVYGDEWKGFHHTVKKWAEHHFPATNAEYNMHDKVYPDGPTSIRNFSPEHDAHWANPENQSISMAPMVKSPAIISSMIHHDYDADGRGYLVGRIHRELSKNPNLTPQHEHDLLNHPENTTTGKEHILRNTKHQETLNSAIINPENHKHMVGNPNLKAEHLGNIINHHIKMDMNLSAQSNDTKTLISDISNHKNLTTEHAEKIAEIPEAVEFPKIISGVMRKVNSDTATKLVNGLDSNHLEFYGDAIKAFAENHPHKINTLDRQRLYYGYTHAFAHPVTKVTFEDEMLSRQHEGKPDTAMHKIVASNSDRRDVLEKLRISQNNEVSRAATGRLARLDDN